MSLQLKRVTCRLFRTPNSPCKRKVSSAKRSSRFFSTSAECQTRQRKSMWTWMTTHGKNFQEPLPGSTNYLGAYEPNGELARARPGATENQPLPPEQSNDLMPFPQNRAFRSERVVSEAMREDIWAKVMRDGQSVKSVSAQLGVEINRVGAIVRLKEVEKQWIQRVSNFQ
jgi:hypothetical protein